MGKGMYIMRKGMQWMEIKDIYRKVLTQGFTIEVERVREDGSYVVKLTGPPDFTDWQMGELTPLHESVTYRVLSPVEED